MSDWDQRAMRGTFLAPARRREVPQSRLGRGGRFNTRAGSRDGAATCSAVCMHLLGCRLYKSCSRYRVGGARGAGSSGSGYGAKEP